MEFIKCPTKIDSGGTFWLFSALGMYLSLHFCFLQVVEDDTPPKKRRGRRRRSLSRHRASYHSKARAAAPSAYQGRKTGLSGGQSPRKRQAHHDSSSTSSGKSEGGP